MNLISRAVNYFGRHRKFNGCVKVSSNQFVRFRTENSYLPVVVNHSGSNAFELFVEFFTRKRQCRGSSVRTMMRILT